jgi:ATP-dependent Clp protease ATP-binding subunit ClpC
MSNLNPNIPTSELAGLMTTAAGKMKSYQLKLLTPHLLLRTFLDEPKSIPFQILQQLQKQRGFDLDDLTRRVEMMAHTNKGRNAKFYFTDDFGKDISLDDEMLVVIDEGLTMAQARDELKAGGGHLLAAMAQHPVTTSAVLQRVGVNPTAVLTLLNDVGRDGTPIIHDFVAEAKAGRATVVFERQELLRDLISLISLAQNRHVILVGPEGAGKRTLGHSLAQYLAEGTGLNELRSLVQISETALLENPLAAVRAGLRRASGGILLIPNIQRFFADKLRAPFPDQVNREVQKAFLGNEQIVIGTTTPGDYQLLSQNSLIRQNSQRLNVPPTTVKETISVIHAHQERLKREYEVVVKLDALETAAQIASQYMKNIALPAAAIQLAEQSCALVRIAFANPEMAQKDVSRDNILDGEDVMLAAAQITNIPVSKLNEDERGKYANMVEHLHKRIIGQETAVLAVSRAVKTARVGLRDPKRPIGSFLFLGPSGVGKSELAKALAEFMFGAEEAMLVLDMSEFQEEASVNKLIGAPPGYVGFKGGGQLTNFVRERPYTVVLFDEVEKAHQRVFDVLLQVMEEGRLTDSQGRQATFSETVIIMTSNLGSKHMLVPTIGETEKNLVMADVHDFFRPEFLNRLDDVILFHQLSGDQLAFILDLMLKKEFKLAARQNIQLTLTDAAKQWLLSKNDQPQYGARPLRRIIARFLREPLANFLLSQSGADVGGETAVTVDAALDNPEENLIFTMI